MSFVVRRGDERVRDKRAASRLEVLGHHMCRQRGFLSVKWRAPASEEKGHGRFVHIFVVRKSMRVLRVC